MASSVAGVKTLNLSKATGKLTKFGHSTPRNRGDTTNRSQVGGNNGGGNGSKSQRLVSYTPHDELDDVADKYEVLIAERESRIQELDQRLDNEQRRVATLESEIGLTLAASHRAEEAHAAELAKVEADVSSVLAERRALLEKLQSVEVIEDAVRDLVVQMRFRVAEDGTPPPALLQQEKQALKKEHVLVALGSLHAQLKALWQFKVDAEDDMRAARGGWIERHAKEVLRLKADIRQAESLLRDAQEQREEALRRAADETAARETVSAEAQVVLTQMATAHQDLLAALKGAVQEGLDLRKALVLAQEEGRKRDSLVLRNKQLESARHFDRVAQDKELRIIHGEHGRRLAMMQRELAKVGDLLLRNEALRGRLGDVVDEKRALSQQARAAQSQADTARRRANLSAKAAEEATRTLDVWSREKDRGQSRSFNNSNSISNSRRSPPRPASAAAELMKGIRSQQKKLAADRKLEIEDNDPIYKTLGNVNKMYREGKESINEFHQSLSDASEMHDRSR